MFGSKKKKESTDKTKKRTATSTVHDSTAMQVNESKTYLQVEGSGQVLANVSDLINVVFQDVNPATVTSADKEAASKLNISLCFGEILPEGVTKIFDADHLNVENAKSVVDLGMGIGRLCIQAFLEHPNLTNVTGVEFCDTRVNAALKGLSVLNRMLQLEKTDDILWKLEQQSSTYSILHEESLTREYTVNGKFTSRDGHSRALTFKQEDLFNCVGLIREGDIVILETKIRSKRYGELQQLLNQMKIGSRLLTYENLNTVYRPATLNVPDDQEGNNNDVEEEIYFPFQPLDINISSDDRFLTSWSPSYGHHFYLYRKFK